MSSTYYHKYILAIGDIYGEKIHFGLYLPLWFGLLIICVLCILALLAYLKKRDKNI